MYKRAFNEEFRICWYLYVDGATNRCRVEDFLDSRQSAERDKVIARMREWARNGNWSTRVGFVKQLELPKKFADVSIFEVKSHQDRILFVRCGNSAVAIDGTQKKDDWSKRDQTFLEAAAVVARAAMSECRGGKK